MENFVWLRVVLPDVRCEDSYYNFNMVNEHQIVVWIIGLHIQSSNLGTQLLSKKEQVWWQERSLLN